MITVVAKERQCSFCGKAISGRLDKKFCDDNCRNNYHYVRNKDANLLIKAINHTLLKNRSVLAMLCCNAKNIVERQKMEENGFDFNCFTALYKTRKGDDYRLVYDYAYKIIDDNVLIIKY